MPLWGFGGMVPDVSTGPCLWCSRSGRLLVACKCEEDCGNAECAQRIGHWSGMPGTLSSAIPVPRF